MDGASLGSVSETTRKTSALFRTAAAGPSGLTSARGLSGGLFEHFLSLPSGPAEPAGRPPLIDNSPPARRPDSAQADRDSDTAGPSDTAVAPSQETGEETGDAAAENRESADQAYDNAPLADSLMSIQSSVTSPTSAADAQAASDAATQQPSPVSPETNGEPAEQAAAAAAKGRGGTDQTTADGSGTNTGSPTAASAEPHAATTTTGTTSAPSGPSAPQHADLAGSLPADAAAHTATASAAAADDQADPAAAALAEQTGTEPQAVESDPRGRHRSQTRSKWFARPAGETTAADAKRPSAADPAGETSATNPVAQSSTASDSPVGAAAGADTAAHQTTTASATPAAAVSIAIAAMAPGSAPTAGLEASAAGSGPSAVSSIASSPAAGEGAASEANQPASRGAEPATGSPRPASVGGTDPSLAGEPPDPLTQAERVRMIQRIARSFNRLGPSGGSMTIKLHPPQLGSLSVQVKLEGRTMTARLATESSAAREVILENLPVLRGRLAEQGIEIASFQVEVGDTSTQVASDGQPSGNGQSQQDAPSYARQADYRRLAAMDREASSGRNGQPPVLTASAAAPAWQPSPHIDMQA